MALSAKCSAGLQVDIAGGLSMDLSVENALSTWVEGTRNLFNFAPRDIFSGCVPFEALVARELRGRADGDLPAIPEASTSSCATSVSGLSCADPKGTRDPDLNCNISTDGEGTGTVATRDYDMEYRDHEEELEKEYDEKSISPRAMLLEKRDDQRTLYYCDTKAQPKGTHMEGFSARNQGAIRFSRHPSSGNLVNLKPAVPTYDAESITDCENFNLAVIETPQDPSNKANTRTYATEHILEAQTVQRFFNDLALRWSQNLNSEVENPFVQLFTTPLTDKDNDIPWCEYMKAWWGTARARRELTANDIVGSAMPSREKHIDEFVLLETTLNSAVKQNWFSAQASYHTGSIKQDIENRLWSKVAKTIKLQILGWKYYNDKNIRKSLVAQAQRTEDKLRELEGDGSGSINTLFGNFKGKYDKSYRSQGLADLWHIWVRAEHARVERDVKKWLETWVKKAYDRNRPAPPDGQRLAEGEGIQLNPNIVAVFEKAWAEVQALEAWNIDWDGDEMDTD